jgi:hypothetical protein
MNITSNDLFSSEKIDLSDLNKIIENHYKDDFDIFMERIAVLENRIMNFEEKIVLIENLLKRQI